MQKKGWNMFSLRIIDGEFNLLGEIDQYESLQMTTSFSGIGQIELLVNRYVQYAEHLTMDNIIFPSNRLDRAFIILNREIELDESGKATERWKITGLSLKAFMAQRLIYPTPHQTHNIVNAAIEDAMIHYVTTEMINPINTERIYPRLAIKESLHRGNTINKKIRFDGLAETLESISKDSDYGWNVEIDLVNKQFVFVVLEGKNRSVNQSLIPAAIFSTEFETLAKLSFAESKIDYKNVAICAGQGEGVDRTLIEVGTASGKERYEVFIDARDISNDTEDETPRSQNEIEAELQGRAQEKLEEYKQTLFLEGQALDSQSQQFERDYFLGDIVTLQDKGWGVTIDVRITLIKEVIENNKYTIDITYDNDRPTLISKIKRELKKSNKMLQV